MIADSVLWLLQKTIHQNKETSEGMNVQWSLSHEHT
jgi:hypothetical protein